MNPRPESRISSLEQRASTIEATLLELSSDQAEELKAIRQDIKLLDEGIKASYLSIGEALDRLDSNTEALKQDVNKRFDKVDSDIAELKSMMKQLLQQKG